MNRDAERRATIRREKGSGYFVDMPTVLRQDGFRVMIRTADHEPPHVHCIKAGAEILIEIETSHIRENRGMPTNEIRNAVELIEANEARLMAAWRRIFPS